MAKLPDRRKNPTPKSTRRAESRLTSTSSISLEQDAYGRWNVNRRGEPTGAFGHRKGG
jgi:hypothetical protein